MPLTNDLCWSAGLISTRMQANRQMQDTLSSLSSIHSLSWPCNHWPQKCWVTDLWRHHSPAGPSGGVWCLGALRYCYGCLQMRKLNTLLCGSWHYFVSFCTQRIYHLIRLWRRSILVGMQEMWRCGVWLMGEWVFVSEQDGFGPDSKQCSCYSS